MLTKGVIIDEEGESFELSNALIILTCSTGVSKCNPVSCKCTEMDCSEKDAAMGTTSSEEHDCDVLRFHRTVLETRRLISELVDEELVLNNLSPADLDCNTRIWCREIIDKTLEGHELILYPSEAFVHFLAASYGNILSSFNNKCITRPSSIGWLRLGELDRKIWE